MRPEFWFWFWLMVLGAPIVGLVGYLIGLWMDLHDPNDTDSQRPRL